MVAGVTMLLILLTGTMNVMATAVIANILLSPINRSLRMQKIDFAAKAFILLVATFLCVSLCPLSTSDEKGLQGRQVSSGDIFLPSSTRSAQINKRDMCEQPSRGRVVRTHNMEATAYTHTGNNTASGAYPRANHTVAADPDVLPIGTMVLIDGKGPYRVEDAGLRCGTMGPNGYYLHVQGNRIDIFMDTRAECLEFGRRQVRVEVLRER